MEKRIILLLLTVLGMSLHGEAQSVEEQADRIGLVGFWKMMRMNGKSKGKLFSHDLDGKKFYIFKNDGTCQYATNAGRIAKASWRLRGKKLTIQGNDRLNDLTYPRQNAEAAYRLACYYEIPNAIFMRNEEKAREYLLIAKQWAEKSGDNSLLQRVNNALK